MRFLIPIVVAAALLWSCFMPWMIIESKGLTITGVDTTGTSFGKPAYFHFFWTGLFLIFFLINRVWSRRTAMVFSAFNLAWAFRNFMLLPACQMGDCPVRQTGLYILFVSAILLFITCLLAPVKKRPATADPSQKS
jgi:TM2 domain-containing membrane protein YozV